MPRLSQVQSRFNDDGTNKSTECSTETGRLYLQALLNEMGLGEMKPWVKQLSEAGDDGMRQQLNALFNHLLV